MALTKIDLSGGTGGGAGQYVYTAPNGITATSSAPTYSSGSNYIMSYLFNDTPDGSATTQYWLTNSAGNQTLVFDFDAYTIDGSIAQISVYPMTRTDASSSYSIDVSDDGTTWTEVVPFVANGTLAYGTERKHENLSITQRYVRFNLTRNGSWGVTLNEIEF